MLVHENLLILLVTNMCAKPVLCIKDVHNGHVFCYAFVGLVMVVIRGNVCLSLSVIVNVIMGLHFWVFVQRPLEKRP